ncbi:hypothetical protein P7K49_030847 [Saguinus oedipus]|uniref:Uncharacterized protein n=1 Tax=Saguinus oedipus TaxID=9490 RepID=A0ABQ9U3C0_SAGOE|nr:hypothetical protein P7K49_030847 [Saguinus oedipus]
MPHPFCTVLSRVRRLTGRELRANVSAEGRDFRRDRYKAPRGRGTERRGETRSKGGPCRPPGHCKPRGTASSEAVASSRGARKLRGTTSPGRLRSRGPGNSPMRRPCGARSQLPAPGRGHVRPAGLARSAAPGRGATGRHARPQRAHTPGHAHRRPGPRPPRPAFPRAPPPPSRRRPPPSHWPHGA